MSISLFKDKHCADCQTPMYSLSWLPMFLCYSDIMHTYTSILEKPIQTWSILQCWILKQQSSCKSHSVLSGIIFLCTSPPWFSLTFKWAVFLIIYSTCDRIVHELASITCSAPSLILDGGDRGGQKELACLGQRWIKEVCWHIWIWCQWKCRWFCINN